MQGPTRPVHPVTYENMADSIIMKSSMLTKSGSGPKGLDVNGWCRIFNLRKTIAQQDKKLCARELFAYRLISLDKKHGLRPIGVGEVLQKMDGKAVDVLASYDVFPE